MRFGVALPTYSWPDLEYATAAKTRELARQAEELGFDSLWAIEHLLTAPGLYGTSWMSPLLCLSHAAAVTTSINIGTAILILSMRNPVHTAKEIATLDALSGGRFILGVGVGWDPHEFEVSGVPMAQRGARTDEALEAIQKLLAEPSVTFQGRFFQFQDVTIDPRPRRRVPIWVAGGSRVRTALSPDPPEVAPSVLRRIVRHDAWIARAAGTFESIVTDWRRICDELRAQGRNPQDLLFSHVNFCHLVDADDREKALRLQEPLFTRMAGPHRPWERLQAGYLTGTTRDIVATIKELERAGLQHIILAPLGYHGDQFERYASEIVPHFPRG